MKNFSAIRVACLGAGYFARFHYDAWNRIDGAQVIGACDLDATRAQATGAHAFSDLKTMLEVAQPDLLDIITPPPSHLDAIGTALDAGVKTIICQKPFCRNYSEALKATTLAEEAGATLVIHENFRFQPWYRTIRSMIDAGELGDVSQITFRLRTGDGQGNDAYLHRQPYFRSMPRLLMHETGVHWIDTFRYLLGEPEAVYADIRKLNPVIAGEDAGYFILDFPGNRRALFDGNRLLDHNADNHRTTLGEAAIEGTKATALLDGNGAVSVRAFGENQVTTVLHHQEWPGFGGDCVRALNEHVIRGIEGRTALENTARNYLKIIVIKDAIYKSAETGQKIWGFDDH
ncbi:Gfo/Idh/MocA family oxidoreductase [Shinella sp. 838]|uniref:Gfo/Idh/MocA family protein n=1 Tax=Shinella sp. 838 TaxID=3038164 RepID=UPI0024153E41|nr:Gfo/Idh/MocA family oxidoreductase [Shinella sp. 838]MDG4674892.1 Gfo/Idh/MocA family oxidoreductase [Shinella sp. 838]